MLGHSKAQSDEDQIIRILGNTVSEFPEVIGGFVLYTSKNSVIVELYKILGDDILKFLSVFGGINIKFPSQPREKDLSRSHLPEILSLFGKEKTEQLYDRFAGTTVKMPTMKSVVSALRDVDIYCRVKKCIDKDSRRKTTKFLSSYYNIKVSEVNFLFRHVKKEIEGE